MNDIIIPDYLKQGDRIEIISPSGNIDSKYITGAKSVLENWGLNVIIAPHAQNKYGRFCGTIKERLYDLQTAIDNPLNKAILCSRGGYGLIHLAESLNLKKLKENPKWIIGYSDITILHQLCLKNKLASLHAPMAKHLVEEGESNKSSLYLKEILFKKIPTYKIAPHPLNITGEAEGILAGGNLAVLYSLIGTKYFKLTHGYILFIEDIGEQPYQIDRMMWSLKLSGILSKLNGLIVGNFSNYKEDPLMYASVYKSIKDIIAPYNIPVAFDFPVGHTSNNYPLIHGGKTKLSVNKNNVVLENNKL